MLKRTDAKRLGTIIDEMFAATGQSDTYDEQRLCYLWAEVAGPTINRYTTRRYVDRGTLHVYITSASLKNELSYLTDALVRKLNEATGRDVISKIEIH